MTWFKKLLWWQTEGTEIVCYDNNGKRYPVRFRGTNMIGFETGFFCFGDMWEKDNMNHSSGGGLTFDNILDKIQELGFNGLRIPLTAVFLMEKLNQKVQNLGSQNNELKNKTYGELLHIVLAKCCERNILVLLDFHKCETGEIEEMFSDKYPESRVMECHRILCNQYANNYNCVFGIELKNEPHIKNVNTWEKKNSTGAHWDTGPEHLQWKNIARRLGNEVLKHSPHIVVVVDGISFHTPWDSFKNYSWWGSHWKQCKDYNSYFWLDVPNKYVASMHPYGPSVAPTKPQYYEPNFPQNMYEYLDTVGFYLVKENHCPILVTEWGGKTEDTRDNEYQYFLADYMKQLGIWNFHWSFNRLSSDTTSVYNLNHDTGEYYFDWNRFDICKRACPEPTYFNLKQMVNENQSQQQSRSLNLSLNLNMDDISNLQELDPNVPAVEFPDKYEECNFFLPMSFKTSGNKININNIPVQLAGLTWYGLEKQYHLNMCQSQNQLQVVLNNLKDLGFNYLRLPISFEPLLNTQTQQYFNCIKNIIDTASKYGFLVGLCLYNHKHGDQPSELWYSEQFGEVLISETLSNLVLSLRLCPNFFSIEIMHNIKSSGQWGNGDFTNDILLANERIGNQILSKNPKILLIVNTDLKQIDQEYVDLAFENRVVYQQTFKEYYTPGDYENGVIGQKLNSEYSKFINSTNAFAPMIFNLDISFKDQNYINQTYSFIRWCRQNNIPIIVDSVQDIIQQLQTRMAQDFFKGTTTKFCFKKRLDNKQMGYEDINYQEQLKNRVLQGRNINIPDKIRSQIPEHKDYTRQEMQKVISPRHFNKSIFKSYPDEQEIREDIKEHIFSNIQPPVLQEQQEVSREINLSGDIGEDFENQLSITKKILHNWIDGKGVPHQLFEIVLKNISGKTINDFELQLTPSKMIKQIWEVSSYEENGEYIISLPSSFKNNTKLYNGNQVKFGYITQFSTPNLLVKQLFFEN